MKVNKEQTKHKIGKLNIKDRNEEIKSFKFSKKLIKELNFDNKDMYIVPIRRNGLTGSGQLHCCHENVSSLVLRFGGKKVYGYMLNKDEWTNEQGQVFYTESWTGHSVWETPEGNLVDVTLGQTRTGIESFRFIKLNSITPEDKTDLRYFGDFMCTQKGEIYDSSIDGFNFTFSEVMAVLEGRSHAKPMSKKVLKLCLKPMFYRQEKLHGDEWTDYSNFSNKSIGTGKTISEIPVKEEYKHIFNLSCELSNGSTQKRFM